MNNASNPSARTARGKNRQINAAALILLLGLLTPVVWAQRPETDLRTASLEDLMNIEVTSVSKKEEKLFQTAAAIYVITQEEIRRSGLTNLPELLRLVPGLSVARIDGNKWAISARGFNGRFANKLLVLIDGRTVYSPETSGVYWEVQDLPLETIERVEVIRGPGGTLWGANAVNGVINIITKHTKDTRGGVLTTGGGSEERGFGSARYGGQLGEQADYRIYTKYFNRSSLVNALGRTANDGQQSLRGGGRIDWPLTQRDALTLQGDIYRTNIHETSTNISLLAPFAPFTTTPGEFTGGNMLGRWTRAFSKQSDLALQLYYDRFNRDIYDLGVSINTVDLDFQHRFALGRRQGLVWGGGYRHVWDKSNGNSSTPVQFTPARETSRLASIFAQDEITLVKDRLRLILGSKLQYFSHQHDTSSDLKVQPNLRVSWTPGRNQSVWGAISHAVRTSARTEEDLRANYAAFPGPNGIPNVLTVMGNKESKFEAVRAHELGYRVQPGNNVSFDLTAFYNRYDHLQTFELGQPFFEAGLRPHVVIPIYYDNLMRGETYGAEVSANWNVVRHWKLSGSYSLLRMQLQPAAASRDVSAEQAEGHSPRHQFQVHSWLKLPRNFEFDSSFYSVSALSTQQIPGYTRLDARLGWRVKEGIELSLGLQNLLDNRHPEFNGTAQAVVSSEIKRSIYGKLIWHF
jgi:iron complex outermembrane recepter protein